MEAFVITLEGNEYSERVSQRCIDSANIEVKRFPATNRENARQALADHGLTWTWGTQKNHHSYGGDLEARIGCAMSHYRLWLQCTEPMLVLEHDAVFVRPFKLFEFHGICQINDPSGATPRGAWWREQMVKRGPGVWPKTRVFNSDRPDGLAGNSAYVIKPFAAKELVRLYRTQGVWPNDAAMCVQSLPYLQEHYPFITRVDAEQSTINA